MKDSSLQNVGEQFGIDRVVDLFSAPFVQNKTCLLPYSFVKKRQVLPIKEKEGKIVIAIADPLDMETIQQVRLALDKETIEEVADGEKIFEAIEHCYRTGSEASHLIASLQVEEAHLQVDDGEGYDLLDHRVDAPVIKMLNAILLEAIQQGASDIHFDPMEQGIGVRYRVDGVLQLRHSPPKEYQMQLITRIKVLSQLDIAEQRLPQDGRIKLRMGGRQIDFRVSTIPCVFGERVVLRILDKSHVLLGLSHMGMKASTLRSFQKLIHLPEGIVLVTGPTGSGKTTTLYSALSEINSAAVNIMTIEDPVEYKLQGMAQMGVNPKIHLSFARGLRHILRQDPDVIMIGEIRDRETAEIAIQASLTGHLVLSTLHTNDAPSALTRLIDMGIEPYLLTSSVVGVMAQRLVRVLCPHCKKEYRLSEEEMRDLQWEHEGSTHCYRSVGCDVCFGSGYKGRHGIYELMPVDHAIKQQVLRSADAHQLQGLARNMGMRSLRQEAADLVMLGVTSTEEALRVTRSV